MPLPELMEKHGAWMRGGSVRLPKLEKLPTRARYRPRSTSDVLPCLARLLDEDEVAAALWAAL